MSRYSTVLFDLDGTLTDPAAGIIGSLVHALEAVGRSVDDREPMRALIGPPLVEGFSSLGLTPNEVDAAITAYREHYATTGMFDNALIPAVDVMLAELARDGRRLAVATSKPEPFARAIVEHFGIDAHFVVVAGATLDHRRRHKAQIILHALEHLELPDPSTVVMVGDREHDVLGAAEHGVATIGVLWGYGSRAELDAAGAEHVVATVDELRATILAP